MSEILNAEQFDSELVVGLVCAVGSDTEAAVALLRSRLGDAGYHVHVVKVSRDVIPRLVDISPHDENKQFERITCLMNAGNHARESADDDAVLATGAAAEVYALRSVLASEKQNHVMHKTAIIIDSLKRPEEVELLRQIYSTGFLLLGIHEVKERRLKHLVKDLGISEDNAKLLIERDTEEGNIDHGQQVNKTFHLADFFVGITDKRDSLRSDIQRMVELWFGNPFITPTFDEHAMFLAFAAGLRSADLSRQVGAVVARNSQILSMGANDCPQSGGGLYWPTRQENGCIDDLPSGRDYTRQDGDSNRSEQNRIIQAILGEGIKKYGFDEEKLRGLLENSRIRDLTEYGRVVHAEMEALLSCGRNAVSTAGASLYSTTFPCHNCAKHIIAAGIERVVYVEPYPKSKALEFHNDAICEEREIGSKSLVLFEPFVGVGPRRFFDLFSMKLGSSYPLNRKVKKTAKPFDWQIQTARLRVQMKPVSYLDQEKEACELFNEKLKQASDKE